MQFIVLAGILHAVVALRIAFTPNQLVQQLGGEQIKLILQTFVIEEESIYLVATLLQSEFYNFGRHFYFAESAERLLALEPYSNRVELHSNIFSLPKLLVNLQLACLLLHPDVIYGDSLVRNWPQRPSIERLIGQGFLLESIMIKSIAQMDILESLGWLEGVVALSSDQLAVRLLEALTLHMTPEMMVYFLERSLSVITLGQSLKVTSTKIQEYMEAEGSLGAVQVLLAGWHLEIKGTLSNSHLLAEAAARLDLVYDDRSEELEMEYKKVLEFCFNGLGALIQPSARRSVWSTFAHVVSKCLDYSVGNLVEVIDAAQFVLQSGVPDHIPPFYSVRVYRSLQRVSFSNFPVLPIMYLPISAFPLGMRLKKWLYAAPLSAMSFDAYEEFDDSSLRRITWRAYYGTGNLPLNRTPHPVGRRHSIGFGDAVLRHARKVLKARMIAVNNLIVTISAWAYALTAGEKLDLSFFFSLDERETCWDSFSQRIANDPRLPHLPDIMLFLRTLGITRFFSPVEIRRLIDSSYPS